MRDRDSVRFVGVKASFPIDNNNRRVGILRGIIELEHNSPFKKIEFGKAMGKVHKASFTESNLEEKLGLLESGTVDKLSLIPHLDDHDWVRSYETSPRITWYSTVIEPFKRQHSPLEHRFGSSGHVIAEYPLSRFASDWGSPFQHRLVSVLKQLFVQQELHSAYINQGYKPSNPSIIGKDYVFSQTRAAFPLSMFEYLLEPYGFSKEYLRGAFWTNFLNAAHVKSLGGMDRMRSERPCRFIEELGEGGVMLQVSQSPLSSSEYSAAEDYQRLRSFLKPILMETSDDEMRLQREVLGAWKPPESADKSFRELVAGIRKRSS